MHKDHQPARRRLGQAQIQHLPRARAIAQAAEPPLRFQTLAQRRSGGLPARRIVRRTGNMGGIGIGIAEIHRHSLLWHYCPE